MADYPSKAEVAKLYESRCFVCHRKFGKRFTFHHLWYTPGEPIYRDFKSKQAYEAYLHPYILKHQDQFILLCTKHHFAVESLKRFKKANLNRLLKAVRMSS